MAERPPPSAIAIAFASAIIAGLAGYFLGQASTIGVFGKQSQPGAQAATRSSSSDKAKSKDDESDISDAESASEDDEGLDDQELKGFEDSNEECKLVLVVRTDLGMTKGELIMIFHLCNNDRASSGNR